MKRNNELAKSGKPESSRAVCFATCRSLNAQISGLKQSIVREFQAGLPGDDHMIEAAVNEAEALAWQTPYPHLFFPALAREKAAAATKWAMRQRTVRQSGASRAFAA